MQINTISTASSVKLPELNLHHKILITETDDKGFAQDQANKIMHGLYLRKQLKLKPWEKDSFKNIYKSSGKSNHKILKYLKFRINSGKSLNSQDLSNSNYYKEHEIKTINDSQEISKEIKLNSEIRRKFKQPSPNIRSYTIETKEICKNNMLSEVIKGEKEKMKKKLFEYERALKNEMKYLEQDIFKFEQYATNELLKRSQKNTYIHNIESNRKKIALKIKRLSQETNPLKDEIFRVLRRINGTKIYVNFIHKLFGGEPELSNINLDNINFIQLKENEIHSLINMMEDEMKKSEEKEENILISSSEEDLIKNMDKLDIVFKVLEENIMKTLAQKEKIRNEIILINHNGENDIDYMKKIIEKREKEYQELLKEYETEKHNIELISFSSEKYNNFIRKLHIELFEAAKNTIFKNKDDIDEYNVLDKIIKPTLKDITTKEKNIDSLLIEMEKFSNQDKDLFNKSVIKVKNENKIVKYYEEKNNRDIANSLRNSKILEKINKIIITGKYKYKTPVPLNIIKKRKNEGKELKTEPTEYKMLNY